MAYSSEILSRARRELDARRADHDSRRAAREQEIYERLPRVREIDRTLRNAMVLAAQAAFSGNPDALEQVKAANLSLQAERKTLIAAHFPPEYLDDGPLCPRCGGSGYIGSQMCTCLEALCRKAQSEQLALLACGVSRFEDFHLDYYPDTPVNGISPRRIMTRTLSLCKAYAEGFTPGSGNLLFNGGTGLGKTFLSACIARTVAERGYSVAYESAAHLFGKLEKDHFRPDEDSARAAAALTACDLLIIDDLGTELTGNFTAAALYTLINDRLLAGKPMIISTNLTIDELRQRYNPQIASRLQGAFQLLPFMGNDIRILKNK